MLSSGNIKDSKREEGNALWSQTRLPTPVPEHGGTSGSPQGTLGACVLIKPQQHHEVGALVNKTWSCLRLVLVWLLFSCSVVAPILS